MKVIFLDFDGVLNSASYFKKQGDKIRRKRGEEHWLAMIDPECVKNLNKIIEETGAVIVISSSWRIPNSLDKLRYFLRQRGFEGLVIDRTPLASELEGIRFHEAKSGNTRAKEIQQWLNENDVVENYVILDDSSFPGFEKMNWIKTFWHPGCGLEDKDAKAAIEILNS